MNIFNPKNDKEEFKNFAQLTKQSFQQNIAGASPLAKSSFKVIGIVLKWGILALLFVFFIAQPLYGKIVKYQKTKEESIRIQEVKNKVNKIQAMERQLKEFESNFAIYPFCGIKIDYNTIEGRDLQDEVNEEWTLGRLERKQTTIQNKITEYKNRQVKLETETAQKAELKEVLVSNIGIPWLENKGVKTKCLISELERLQNSDK